MRLTPSDLARFEKAALSQWPGAVLSQAGIVLGLARMAADSILNSDKPE